ncbi:TetR/AcrR family transcriptional regulator [Gluconacetobacter entanii]|uniref:TetR/AcrR family transcriptional regulator n=1 Tax=Gluconacetobacter entanii TaxID=108528 RepID=A0ABT3K183_9PROT|nr:TetR/AcrR family transcriptional regulator [Gluconacetobacter entanii]MCW4589169.1 TetR/AcrR family transcriptional regulator [Gluconacetobacter entanii]MCW4592716.1 TetR/AcrR family transcriptional regulator [Gluconacetobacter entanii]NPC89393.1 TetR/AcrR family transcriptional regulator [Gluconacetobacter entanii]
MRADAQKNYDRLLMSAREAIAEDGVNVSMRDIARRAGVGFATLLRHFPTRETLFEALLRTALDELTRTAERLEKSASPSNALLSWLSEAVRFMGAYNGVVSMMSIALEDENSALHISCTNLRSAGARLLGRAQAEGTARNDIDGTDLFGLIGALGWLGEQPSFAARTSRFFDVITTAIMTPKASGQIKQIT